MVEARIERCLRKNGGDSSSLSAQSRAKLDFMPIFLSTSHPKTAKASVATNAFGTVDRKEIQRYSKALLESIRPEHMPVVLSKLLCISAASNSRSDCKFELRLVQCFCPSSRICSNSILLSRSHLRFSYLSPSLLILITLFFSRVSIELLGAQAVGSLGKLKAERGF